MNPRQKVEGLGEEEFTERPICKERPDFFEILDHANETWLVHNDTFPRSAM